jgi:hypothetical protein
MFRKALDLIRSIAATAQVGTAWDTLKPLIIQTLNSMLAAAALTASPWDDMIIRLALALLQGNAASLVEERIARDAVANHPMCTSLTADCDPAIDNDGLYYALYNAAQIAITNGDHLP